MKMEMSRKTPLTSTVGFLSKAVCTSCIIDSNWAIHESHGRKPDWEGVKSPITQKTKDRK